MVSRGRERLVEYLARHRWQLAGSLELAALGCETDRLGERVENGRFAAAVVTGEQRHGMMLARGHHLDGGAEQTERSDREHLVRVKGTTVVAISIPRL